MTAKKCVQCGFKLTDDESIVCKWCKESLESCLAANVLWETARINALGGLTVEVEFEGLKQ